MTVAKPPVFPTNPVRRAIAERYLAGAGLEIGALNVPLEVPAAATVRYVDRLPVSALRQQYPKIAQQPLVEADILDDGEVLGSIADASQDFLIANHTIEHCEDPISALENWFRVLKPGGILYLAVPDKRYTFDRDREITTIEHLLRDRREGPAGSRQQHYEEWVRYVEAKPEAEIAERVKFRMEMNYSIHFHVWTQADFLDFLLHCRRYFACPCDIEYMEKSGVEFILVLRKHEMASH